MEEVEDEQAPTFGRVLRHERKRLGLTQAELAEKIDTSQQNVAGWEKDRAKPRPEQLGRLLEFLEKHAPPAGTFGEFGPSALSMLKILYMVNDASYAPVVAGSLNTRREKREPLVEFSEQAVPVLHFSRSQEVPTAREMEFRARLPAELRQYIDRRWRNRTLDYWSDRLALEVVRMPRHLDNLLTRGSLALHRLAVLKRSLEREGREPIPKFCLVMMFDDSPIRVTPGGAVQQLQDEASLMDVECVIARSVQDVVHIITQEEAGDYRAEDEARVEGHSDWGDF